MNQTGITNLLYNPYAGLELYDTYTLTEKRLLRSLDQMNVIRQKNILLNDSSSRFSVVPYSAGLYQDTAKTTIQYIKQDLSGELIANAVDSGVTNTYEDNLLEIKNSISNDNSHLMDAYNANLLELQNSGIDVDSFLFKLYTADLLKLINNGLNFDSHLIDAHNANVTKLKNSGLTFPMGSVGVKQMAATTDEDSLSFTLGPSNIVGSLSDWKASYGANVIFKDFLWSGQSFSCVVDINNVPKGDCGINYNATVYRAHYLAKGVSTKQYYILFNKTAADALEVAFKQYFKTPIIVSTL